MLLPVSVAIPRQETLSNDMSDLVEALTLAIHQLRGEAAGQRWYAQNHAHAEADAQRRLHNAAAADRAGDVLLEHLRSLLDS